MGMAASQARYLALVARKSNCEYEGQQINQARLILSNQSANLFTQMLGLEVPVAPSKQDYARLQYSFKDGTKAFTMDKWVQLDEYESGGYNYAVTYHYNKDEQQGAQKIKTNPQVQFNGMIPSEDYANDIEKIQAALKKIADAEKAYETASNNYTEMLNKAKLLTTFSDTVTSNYAVDAHLDDNIYTVTRTGATYQDNVKYLHYSNTPGATTPNRYYNYVNNQYYTSLDPLTPDTSTEHNYYAVNTTDTYSAYSTLDAGTKTKIDKAIAMLKESGALPDSYTSARVYYSETLKAFAFASDLESVGSSTSTLPLYYLEQEDVPTDRGLTCTSMAKMEDDLKTLEELKNTAKGDLDNAKAEYSKLNVPKRIGNIELTPIYELSETDQTAITKIISSMKEEEIDQRITDCFQGEKYIGGLYKYELNGATYYATYYDLADSARSGTGYNNIDDQKKMPIYTVQTVTVPVNKTEKALLETDASGRFTTIRLESDSVTYPLTAETEIDEIAYTDAMNQYDYDKAVYDKRVSDLNAETSLIQRQDQDLELRLKQLDTEQNALATEIDAVSKVVKDNIEKSFKTFGG